ncbi:MAG TPA: 50S ribosomal protein L18 [Ktedonobacterales bacterium]|nr:50S ribosomal protein L18 [Ktedonobacterales bacterium]
MIKKQYANQARLRRHLRVRKKVAGSTARPRLCVFRSANQIYAQIVDDSQGRTLVAATSRDADMATIKTTPKTGGEGDEATPEAYRGIEANRRIQQAFKVGHLIAQRAQAAGITRVVFDRGGYIYHGRVAALADGARKGGLDF